MLTKSEALICVEFGPNGAREYVGLNYLEGCVGESYESDFRRALSSQTPRKNIPVRFPLVGLNSRVELYPAIRPTVKSNLEESGISIHVDDLHPVNKLPVSLYERRPVTLEDLRQEDCLNNLFERAYYLSTFGKAKAIKLVTALFEKYNYRWLWKQESLPGQETIFLEARAYGIDTVIGVYDKKRFGGVALEIITRQRGLPCCRSDLMLFSGQEEYIDYLDGVALERRRIKLDEAQAYLNSATSPSEINISRFNRPEEVKKSK